MQRLGEETLTASVAGWRQPSGCAPPAFAEQRDQLGHDGFAEILRAANNGRLPRDVVEEELAVKLPAQDAQATFDTLVAWARYGELFGYEPETKTLYLDQPGAVTEPAATQPKKE